MSRWSEFWEAERGGMELFTLFPAREKCGLASLLFSVMKATRKVNDENPAKNQAVVETHEGRLEALFGTSNLHKYFYEDLTHLDEANKTPAKISPSRAGVLLVLDRVHLCTDPSTAGRIRSVCRDVLKFEANLDELRRALCLSNLNGLYDGAVAKMAEIENLATDPSTNYNPAEKWTVPILPGTTYANDIAEKTILHVPPRRAHWFGRIGSWVASFTDPGNSEIVRSWHDLGERERVDEFNSRPRVRTRSEGWSFSAGT